MSYIPIWFRIERSVRVFQHLPFLAVVALLALSITCAPSVLTAQEKATPKKEEKKEEKKDEKKTAEKPGASDEEEIPAPEDISRTTDDGLVLSMTYFGGTKGKESIPVILLHGSEKGKGSRKDFIQEQGLASFLQHKLGCAVVVPDLRGHGESTTFKTERHSDSSKRQKTPIKTKTIKPDRLAPADYIAMTTQDLLVVKRFLWEKNNEGKLNIDKLCVVGAEMGASVALNFVLFDEMGYDQKTPNYGPLKLGKFIKVLVLLSPELNYRGLSTTAALADREIKANLPILILVGKKTPARLADAERFYSIFSNARPGLNDQKPEDQTLWCGRLDTSLQGTKMLDEASLTVPRRIGLFIWTRLVKNPDAKKYAWKERKLPHQE